MAPDVMPCGAQSDACRARLFLCSLRLPRHPHTDLLTSICIFHRSFSQPPSSNVQKDAEKAKQEAQGKFDKAAAEAKELERKGLDAAKRGEKRCVSMGRNAEWVEGGVGVCLAMSKPLASHRQH